MRTLAAAGLLLLSACGDGDSNAAAANDATAAPAKPVPVAGRPTPVTPSTSLPPGGGIPGVSAPPPANDANAATSDTIAAEEGSQEAVAVLRRYFAAIGTGRYDTAYRLWNGRGEASGMSARAFAESFAEYVEYRATIGTPGRIDAGAGQRYVEIPVRVTGRRQDGTPVSLAGSVTLHRTGDIDGATAEQRAWRIQAIDLKPRPAMDTATPQ